jgi:hypothetical protein
MQSQRCNDDNINGNDDNVMCASVGGGVGIVAYKRVHHCMVFSVTN